MDELLDFMIAGPKLRKWYGESDEMEGAEGGEQGLPRDGDGGEVVVQATTTATTTTTSTSTSSALPSTSSSSPLPPAPEGTRDAVIVVSADGGPVAEAVLLQLILAKGETESEEGFFGEGGFFDEELLIVPESDDENDGDGDDDDDFEPAIDFEPAPKTFLVPLVKDREAALSSFGKYALPIDERDEESLKQVLQRASAVVVAGGGWERVLRALEGGSAPPRLVALVGDGQGGGGLGALLAGLAGAGGGKREAAAVSDPKREAALLRGRSSSRAPLTLVRAIGGVRDAPGGGSAVVLLGGGRRSGGSSSSKRPVAAGDAAAALAAAALLPEDSSASPSLVEVCIADAGPGTGPADWSAAISDAVLGAAKR